MVSIVGYVGLFSQKPLRDSLAVEKYITKGNLILSTNPGFMIVDIRDTISWGWQKGREVVLPLTVGYMPTRNLGIFAGGGVIIRSGSLAPDFNSYVLQGFVRFYPFDRFRRKLARREEVTFLHQPFMQRLMERDRNFLFQSLYPVTEWGIHGYNFKLVNPYIPQYETSKYPIQAIVYGGAGAGIRVADGFVIQGIYLRGMALDNPLVKPKFNSLVLSFEYFFPVKPKRDFWKE